MSPEELGSYFAAGKPFVDYVDELSGDYTCSAGCGTEGHRAEFRANYSSFELSDDDLADLAAIAPSRPAPIRVLVISGAFCHDSTEYLPILQRLVEERDDFDLRILERDDNLKLMDAYLFKGKYRTTPTVLFLDAANNEILRWVERPQAAIPINRMIVQAVKDRGMTLEREDLPARRFWRSEAAKWYQRGGLRAAAKLELIQAMTRV
jgi:Thioredoxin